MTSSTETAASAKLSSNTVLMIIATAFFLITGYSTISIAHQTSGTDQCEYLSENVLSNVGFEELTDGIPAPWRIEGGWDSGIARATEEAARTGNTGVKIAIDDGSNYRLSQSRFALEGGKIYELSVWINAPVAPDRVLLSVNFYQGSSGVGKRFDHRVTEFDVGQWQHVAVELEVPAEATNATLYLRPYGPGVVFMDDVSFRATECGSGVSGDNYANSQAIAEVLAGRRPEANVAWWGFDPEDSTDYLQAAIDSGAARVIVPNMGQDWIVRPLILRSDLELVFEEGVVMTAKKGEYLGLRDSMFFARGVENLTLRGYGATLQMHRNDYTMPPYEKGEWRHLLQIRDSKNVQVLGLTLRESGGDGIYLGGLLNEHIVVRDIIADGNHRQGMSVISARNLLVENSVFKNTSGTAPMSGIDFEPNNPRQVLENITVRNSVFDNNDGTGVVVSVGHLNNQSAPVSIVLEDVLIRGSSYGFRYNGLRTPKDQQPRGEVVFRNCIIEGSRINGVRILNKADDSIQVHFEDCILHNVASNRIDMESLESSVPVAIMAGWRDGETHVGGLHFSDVVVADDNPRPAVYGALLHSENEARFVNVTGNIDVVNPYGADVLWNGPTVDIPLVVAQRQTVTVDYDRYNWAYDDASLVESVEVKLGPTISVAYPSPLQPVSVIQGTLTPDIRLFHFESGDVQQVEVLLDGERIYFGAEAPGPEDIEIDTLELRDGLHELTVIVKGSKAGEVRQSVFFSSRNYLALVDPFEGPRQVAWFGSVYNPKTVDQSPGWEYATDDLQSFFGDNSRKFRSENTTEYLIWETPDLGHLTLVLYSNEPLLKDELLNELAEERINALRDVLTLDVSIDGKSWTALNFTVEHADTSPTGWHRLVVHSRLPGQGQGVQLTRLTLHETLQPIDIQLGEIDFQLLRQ